MKIPKPISNYSNDLLRLPISKGSGIPKRLKQTAQTCFLITSWKKLEFG